MGILKNKVVRLAAGFPLTVGLSVGVGLPMAVADVAGAARPAAAAPPAYPASLKDALLAADDLPAGYSALDFDPAEAIAGMIGPQQTSGDPCVAADAVDTDELLQPPDDLVPEWPTTPWRPDGPNRPHRPPNNDEPTKHDKPIKGERPTKGDRPDKGDKPDKADRPVKVMATAEPELEAVAFIKDSAGPVLMETLYDAGRRQAQTMVWQTAEVLERCPDIENEDLRIEMAPLPKMPDLGAASVAVTMDVTLKQNGFEVSVTGKLVAIAYQDVYVTVALVGAPTPRTAELKKIAKTALRKLAAEV